MREAPYVSTKQLTKSFKWDQSDSFTQHDIQEFARVLFEALENSFEDDSSVDVQAINDLFKGESLNYTQCLVTGKESLRHEKWLDL
jgi:ubiquitin carboxyl-terminal hydrolase 47